MANTIVATKLSETLQISECSDGFWLYDKTRGMNLSMQAKTFNDAFVQALTYYQKQLSNVEKSYWALQGQVDSFVSQFADKQDD